MSGPHLVTQPCGTDVPLEPYGAGDAERRRKAHEPGSLRPVSQDDQGRTRPPPDQRGEDSQDVIHCLRAIQPSRGHQPVRDLQVSPAGERLEIDAAVGEPDLARWHAEPLDRGHVGLRMGPDDVGCTSHGCAARVTDSEIVRSEEHR